MSGAPLESTETTDEDCTGITRGGEDETRRCLKVLSVERCPVISGNPGSRRGIADGSGQRRPARRRGLLNGDRLDFLVGRVALQHLVNAVLYERGHAFHKGGFEHILRAGFLLHHSLHLIRAEQQFV